MLAQKSLLIVFQNIVSGLIGYVALLFILRNIGLQPWGILGFAIAFLGMFSVVLDLGFGQANIKRISEGKDFERCIGTYFFIKTILVGLFVIVVFGSLYIWQDILHRGFQTTYQLNTIYTLIPYYILSSYVGYYNSIFTARMEAAKLIIPRFIESVSRNGLYIFASIYMVVGLTNKDQLAVTLAFIMFIAQLVYLLTYMQFIKGWKMKRPTREYLRSYIIFAVPVFITLIITSIAMNVDIVFIQLFWNSTDVGGYFAIRKIVAVLLQLAAPVMALLFPALSALYSNNQHVEYVTKIADAEKYLSMLFLPVIMIFIVLASPILNLWKSALSAFYPIAIVFAIRAYLAIINGPYFTHFNAIGTPKTVTFIRSLTSVETIILFIIFIPTSILGVPLFGLGAFGAALGLFIATVTSFFIVRYKVYKHVKLFGNVLIFKHLIAAGVMGISIYLLNLIIHAKSIYILIPLVFFGFFYYLGILYIIKGFTKQDLEFVKKALNVKDAWYYIRTELKSKK